MNETVSALINIFPQVIPEAILGLFACVLFLGGAFGANRRLWGVVALVGMAAAGVALLLTRLPRFDTRAAAEAALYAGPIWMDRLTILIKAVALVGGAILVLFTWDEVPERGVAEFHGCLLIITAGIGLTAAANDLVLLFLALELTSIPTYVALYLARSDVAGQEAGVKYFLLSVFSSAMLLFGFSYLYGIAGTTNLPGIADALAFGGAGSGEALPGTVLIAVVMVVAGLGFRITAVPFHFYAPDVYQGTSTGMAAVLAFVPKVAGFAALIRVFGFLPFTLLQPGPGTNGQEVLHGGGPIAGAQLSTLLWIVAAVTMTLGNVLALLQDNLKRLFAYSSVAHAGYMLIGLSVAPYLMRDRNPQTGLTTGGIDAVLFYLVAYAAMTIGAFAVLSCLSARERPAETIDDLSGLSKSHPGMALLMTLFLLSLIGIPLTAGFVGKLLLFLSAFAVNYDVGNVEMVEQARLFRILALIAVVNAAISGWYYLRVITAMYLRTPLQPLPKARFSPGLIAVWLCAALTLFFGVYPRPLRDSAEAATVNAVRLNEAAPAVSEAP